MIWDKKRHHLSCLGQCQVKSFCKNNFKQTSFESRNNGWFGEAVIQEENAGAISQLLKADQDFPLLLAWYNVTEFI